MNLPYLVMRYGALEPGDIFYADLKADEVGIVSATDIAGDVAKVTFTTEDGTRHIRPFPKMDVTAVLRKVTIQDRNRLVSQNLETREG